MSNLRALAILYAMLSKYLSLNDHVIYQFWVTSSLHSVSFSISLLLSLSMSLSLFLSFCLYLSVFPQIWRNPRFQIKAVTDPQWARNFRFVQKFELYILVFRAEISMLVHAGVLFSWANNQIIYFKAFIMPACIN